MTVLEKMKERLAPIGVYEEDAAALGWELSAYAAGLEHLYAALGTMFRERFIATAQDEGLKAYEVLFGPERSEETVENRREMLRLRMNLGEGDFTLAGIQKALDSFGFVYTISEYPALGRLTVNAVTHLSPAQQAWISREIAKIVPAHIEFQLTYNTLTWAQWDAMNSTFQARDNEDLTWNQIDNRTASS